LKEEVNVTKIVYERLKVDEKKQIKAGIMETGQLPVSDAGCPIDPEDGDESAPTQDHGPKTAPSTVLNACLLRNE
jgi:hypothetical protein